MIDFCFASQLDIVRRCHESIGKAEDDWLSRNVSGRVRVLLLGATVSAATDRAEELSNVLDEGRNIGGEDALLAFFPSGGGRSQGMFLLFASFLCSFAGGLVEPRLLLVPRLLDGITRALVATAVRYLQGLSLVGCLAPQSSRLVLAIFTGDQFRDFVGGFSSRLDDSSALNIRAECLEHLLWPTNGVLFVRSSADLSRESLVGLLLAEFGVPFPELACLGPVTEV